MRVMDYANMNATETDFDKPAAVDKADLAKEAKDPTMAQTLWAVRDAPAKAGHFPVVVYAPSFSDTSWENADLCEYLASYGYVVVASPSLGVATSEMTDDVAGANAQAADISFLIGYARTLADADVSQVAVVGYSWGGIANLFAAARDNRIKALVALDGSMRYFPELVRQAGDVHPEQMTIPLLFFTSREDTLEDMAGGGVDKVAFAGPNVLNAWTHGDLVTVNMLGMTHGQFSSMSQRNGDVDDLYADYGAEDGATGFAWIARYTLQFLNATLKHDASAMAFLKKKPSENGVPKHVMDASYRAAKGVAPSMEGFRAELGRQGFDQAAEIYAGILKENKDFKLVEEAVNTWAYELMEGGHLPEATALLKLNVQMYPDSGNVYDSLGEAYMNAGKKQLAIENYKKSLEKDPDNENAKKQLKKLEATPAAK
jgi:dienelactone hydrolase/predicted negative regulator of RcsB-dependent stress response